jgi:hypothetical protein
VSIVADTRHQRRCALVPATGRLPIALDRGPQSRYLRLLQTIMLVLTISGALLISGIGASRSSGGPTAARSVAATMAASSGGSLAVLRLGNCPGGSSPCP